MVVIVDMALSVASKVARYLAAPVGRQCGYVIFSDYYVRQLNSEIKKLDHARQRVQHSIEQARSNMQLIEAEVEEWAKDVETIGNKVGDVLKNDGSAKKTCFYRWLPNPTGRYRLGKEASRTVKDIQALIARSHFEKVDYKNPPPGLVGGAPDVNSPASDGGDTITNSRASIFQGIMKALDDEKQKVIGVYGPGGVGKTTLLEEVEKKLRKEGRPFRMIVKAKVSQTPDLNNIQDQIADALSLNLKDKQSQQGRRDLLFQRLQRDPNEKVLIILDDLWKELDLREVGIPSGDESRGCKLLLTSRFKDVLEQKMHADRTFRLEGLKNDEAFRLFEKIVGDKLKDEEFKQIAAKVVKKLAGLPLLITSVASTLKYSRLPAWRNSLKKLEESNIETIETIVKLSYNHLKSDDAKSLFLLCGLIGGTIRIEILLVLGMGLGLFEGFNNTIEDARDRLNTMLDSLRSTCLLQDGGDDNENVTIHDLYSEVVVSTPFTGQNSLMINNNYGSWSKEKLEKCWAICQVNVGSDRLAELMRCGFLNLKILMLSQPENLDGSPAHRHDRGDCCRLDFTYMKELQVLYLRSMHIATLPSSIEILGNLRSLYLDHCEVEDVAILGKLKALQILSFVGSAISRLPKEMGELTNLRLLDLSKCQKLQSIEPGVLKRLINLEELHMKASFDRWMGKDEIKLESCNAKLAELKSMTKLTSLEISIPDPIILLEDDYLFFENLTRFWIKVGNVERREFKCLRTMMLNLEGCNSILSKEWVQKALQKTQYLHLGGFREFKKNANELCIRGFSQLKHLDIHDSPSIKFIACSSNDLLLTAFTTLESLFLKNVTNLEKICYGLVAPECFSRLKVVTVTNCNRLKYLWCPSEKQRLVQLKEIKVEECDSMQAIIMDDAREDKVGANGIVELPNIRHLTLTNLPNMTSFCSGAEITSEGSLIQVSLPSLEELLLHRVGSLTPDNCSKLLNVFSSTIIGRLHNLQEVSVQSCYSLESLFDCGSLDANTEQKIVLLPKLESLRVRNATRLSHVVKSDSRAVLGFPRLKGVRVGDCSELRYLFPYFTATTLEKMEWLTISDCKQMKEVVLKEEDGRSKPEVMSFPCLITLVLKKLENLICFSSGSCSYNFASLTQIRILRCHNFGAFILNPTSVERPLGEMAEEDDESLQPLFNEMVTFPNIEIMEIEHVRCKELSTNQIPIDSFCKLECLQLKHCDNLLRIGPSHMWNRLQCCLKILEVISCRSIEIIYGGDGTDIESSQLKWLVLCDLDNLRHIWKSDGLPNTPFPNLRYVKAVRCSRLEMLFTTFTAKFLGQIKELVVESCEDMKLIAGHGECVEATSMTITFSKLTTLRLVNLPKFRRYLPENYYPEFPSLQVLSKVSCGTERDESRGDWERCQSDIEREYSADQRWNSCPIF